MHTPPFPERLPDAEHRLRFFVARGQSVVNGNAPVRGPVPDYSRSRRLRAAPEAIVTTVPCRRPAGESTSLVTSSELLPAGGAHGAIVLRRDYDNNSTSLHTVRQFRPVLTVASRESKYGHVSLVFPTPFGHCR